MKQHGVKRLIPYLLATLAILAVGVVIPLAMGDGIGNYQGAERTAAIQQMESTQDFYRHDLGAVRLFGTLKLRVDNIYADPNAGMCDSVGGTYSSLAHNPKRFAVVIGQHTLFGVVIKSETYHYCL